MSRKKRGVVFPRVPSVVLSPTKAEENWSALALASIIFHCGEEKTRQAVAMGKDSISNPQIGVLYRMLMDGENWNDGEWIGAMLHLVSSITISAHKRRVSEEIKRTRIGEQEIVGAPRKPELEN